MAETIATGYIQLMPSTKGMKAAIESELKGSVAAPLAAEAKTASAQVSQSLVTAVQRDAAPAMGKAIATSMTASAKTASVGIVTQMKAAVAQFGGTGAVVQGLATQASTATQRLSGLVRGSGALSTATGALKMGLTGVAGLLGGPWGIAIAGGAFAVNAFAQAQQNAADAAQSLFDSLDKSTGKFTAASLTDVTSRIVKDLNRPGDLEALKSIQVTAGQAAAALAQGSDATARYVAHLQDLLRAENGNTQASQTRIAALRGLISTIQNETENTDSATAMFRESATVQQSAAEAARALGLANDSASASMRAQAQAAENSSAKQAIFSLGLDSIANSAANVQTRIDAIPANVRISASAVGLDTITAQANAAFAAMIRLLTLSNSANKIQGGGERHGADVSSASSTAVGQAANQVSAALAAADAAYNRALAAIKSHNASITAKSGGGGGKAGSAAASALSSARQALISQVTDSNFITNLMDADSKGIGRIGSALAKGSAAALSRGRETALTRLVRRDTQSLQVLATQRAAIAKRMQDAQANLDSLVQAKASTTQQLVTSGMGNLVGARSASGVMRVLTRQLATVKAFRTNLGILAKRGLPAPFMQQLLAAGVDGAMTAAALVRASDTDFASITSLTTQLSTASTGLGNDAGRLLYDQGIAAAQGLIKGIASQQSAVESQMIKIAKSMQSAIKKALGIKSPSTVFAALGEQIPAGLGVGIDKGTPGVHRKVASMVPTSSGYTMTSPNPGSAGGGIHAPITITGRDPVEAAHLVANQIAWLAKR